MVDTTALRQQAREEAKYFLDHEQEYRMSYIEAEKPHPITMQLSQTYKRSVEDGVSLLLQVDEEMSLRAAQTLRSQSYAAFADSVRETLANGGRVIFSGCGSSGRLSMRLEQSWRNAIQKLSIKYPQISEVLRAKLGLVGNIMTGGDYAVIRAVESFEDSTRLGMAQAKAWNLNEKDLLVGVTATGETTSILGTAVQALADGARVYMLICSEPQPLVDKMARARDVYNHPQCRALSLPCGPMALTGSTRMQSSSFEQLAGAVALEGALYDILNSKGIELPFPGYGWYGEHFSDMVRQLLSDRAVSTIAQASRREQKVYEAGGLITLFAEDCLLDVLTDTTERSPTFMTPPFCSADMVDQPQSWAFVKNPGCNTEEAWERCFLRQPNCIDWSTEQYAALGLTEKQISKIPDISRHALKRFMIGCEPMPERENHPSSHAMWIGEGDAPKQFLSCAARYSGSSELTLKAVGIKPQETFMDIFEHLSIKLMLNTLSTGVMACMGKIHGNWMTCLAMSNKKLVDRGARIISQICNLPYEQALEELYFSGALAQAQNIQRSAVQLSIERLSSD